MICISSDFYWVTFQVFADSSHITVKLAFIRRVNERFTVFGAEHDMHVVFYE